MLRQHCRLRFLAAVVVLLFAQPLHAQPILDSTSELGPYTYQATLTLGDGTIDVSFGSVVAVSGDTALANGTGVVYVFERDFFTYTWQQVETITPLGSVEGFGRSLAIDGGTAIIGAQGSAHLFRRGARGRWREIATLVPSDGHSNFGFSVGIAGNQAMVGAPGFLEPDLIGAAYVFRRRQENADWREVTILRSPIANFSGTFGASVSISRDTATVTAVGPTSGVADIFSRTDAANDEWAFVRRFVVGNVFMGPAAVQRDTAVYAAGEIQGFAVILGRNIDGTNGWGVEESFQFSEGACCGTYRSVSLDSDRIILGLGGNGTGVDILSRNQGGANVWGRIARFRDAFAFTPQRTNLGASVSISGDTTLMSAPGVSDDPTDNAVHVFVSDIDGDGLRDAVDQCPRDPLNNVSGGCQRASAEHPVLDHLIAQGDVTAETNGRRHVITATFTNTSTTAIKNPFFEVAELTGGVLLNGDGGRDGVGATLSPDVGDGLLSPSESLTVSLEIRLRSQTPFQFRVTLHGDPIGSPTTPPTPTDGYFEIVSRNSGKCLDVFGASIDAGASVIQWTCHGGLNQQWRLDPASGGAVRIIARHSGQALDVFGALLDDLAPIIQWPPHDGDNQAWTLEPVGDGHMRIIARHSGKALDVEFASADDGARVIQYMPHGGLNQQWLIRPVLSN